MEVLIRLLGMARAAADRLEVRVGMDIVRVDLSRRAVLGVRVEAVLLQFRVDRGGGGIVRFGAV